MTRTTWGLSCRAERRARESVRSRSRDVIACQSCVCRHRGISCETELAVEKCARSRRNRLRESARSRRETAREVVEVVEYYHGDGEWYRSSRPLIAVPRATVLPRFLAALLPVSLVVRSRKRIPAIIIRRIRAGHP